MNLSTIKKIKAAYIRSLKGYRGRFVLAVSILVVVLILVFTLVPQPSVPIPKSILSAVSFPIYYPDQSTLPAGYTLELNSFQLINPGVVFFSVSYGQNKDFIVFSEEKMPSNSVTRQFASDYIPLHTPINTPYGQGIFGAYNNGSGSLKSVISLPIQNGPWLIVTAPSNINHNQFVKVIDSLIKS
jgi:hypothetical protein